MSPLKRRGFLQGLGASAALAAGCKQLPEEYALPFLNQPEELVPGVTTLYASTCTGCPAACGLLVTVRDGRPIKLEGLPSHPRSKGGLCAVGQADVRGLYSAKRPQQPVLNGENATWEAVDEFVKSKLEEVGQSDKSIVVLTPSITSPSTRRSLTTFAEQHDAKWVEWDPDPETSSAAISAWEQVSGRALMPDLRLQKADLMVFLGADLLVTGLDPVTHTRAYADRRRAHQTSGPLHHVQIEGTLSLTGAKADERWTATAAEQRLIAFWLLKQVADAQTSDVAKALSESLKTLPGLPKYSTRTAKLATQLLAKNKKCVVWSGANDVGEQLAVALTNMLLGNVGHTLALDEPTLVRRGREAQLWEVREALSKGEVGALITWGVDPVAQLPDGAALAEEIRYLTLSVALDDRPTQTAASCQVVAAANHGLERWADYMPAVGTLTIGQPTLRPIYNTRDPELSLLLWAGEEVESVRQRMYESWEETVYPDAMMDELEGLWNKALSTGLASPEDMELDFGELETPDEDDLAEAVTEALKAPVEAHAFEVHILPEVSRRSGSHTHLDLLDELPDPLAHTAWVATVRVAPQTARALGVGNGDELTVTVGDSSLTLPVRLSPGTHPNVLGVPVGWASNNGWSLTRWVDGRLQRTGLPATVKAAGSSVELPETQQHTKREGRPIVHQVATYDEKVPEPHHVGESLWRARPIHSPSWEMVIDLDTCTGCSACVVACEIENNIPVVGAAEIQHHRSLHWLRMDRYYDGDEANPDVLFEPMMCQQCDHAPCETVCPVLATMHSSDGINQQVYNRCVGTRYCANNCPYKVRRFNWFDYDHGSPLERMALNPDVVVRERGVMEKCTFCVQRIQAARIDGRANGTDPTLVQTACQQSCPAQAIRFGDGSKPENQVAQDRSNPRAFKVLAELGVKPSVTYLARVKNTQGGT